MTNHMPHPPETRLLPPDRRQPLEAFQRIHSPTLRFLAQGIDFGHLVQTKHLRLAFGQSDSLAMIVVQRNEHRGREGHHPRLPHAVGGSDASQKLLHLGRLLAAPQIGPSQAEEKLKQDGGVGSRGGRFRGLRFRAHDARAALPTRPSAPLTAPREAPAKTRQ